MSEPAVPEDGVSGLGLLNYASTGSAYDDVDDDELLDMICDMIEKNRKRDFIKMTFEVDKKRIAKMLVRPVNRSFKNNSTFIQLNNNKNKQPAPPKKLLEEKIIGGPRNNEESLAVVGAITGDSNHQPIQLPSGEVEDPDSIPTPDYDLWWTPLHLMAKQNRVEMVAAAGDSIEELLTKLGGTDNWPDVFGQTPLHVACIKGHVAVCRMLCRQAAAIMAGKARNVSGAHNTVLNLLNTPDKLGCTPLHYTALLQHKNQADELAKILLSNGCDPNLPDIDGFTPLALCAHRGLLELTSLYMGYGANPNVQNPEDGWTPLMLATFARHTKLVTGLLNPQQLPNISENTPRNMAPTPANPSVQSKLGATALIVAAQCGYAEIAHDMFVASKLVQPTINMQDVGGRTALATAVFKGHVDVVNVLLERKANPNLADSEGVTPLMVAIHKGFRTIAEMLIQSGADITMKDENGFTALMIAAQNANVEMTKLLLAAASNISLPMSTIVNAQQKDGTTALIHASTTGNEKLIDLLITAQAALEPSRIVNDWPALFHAIYSNERAKPIKVLLSRPPGVSGAVSPGALVNKVLTEVNRHANITKLTPLILACLLGNSHVTRILLDNGANPNNVDWTDFAPLMAAAQVGEEKLVQLLLARGAKPDLQDHIGYSPLMIAALNGFAKICDMLLMHGASPDLQQINGRTALMFAAENRHANVVQVILRHEQCDLAVCDVFQRTALHYGIIGADEKVMTVFCEVENLDPNVQDRDGVTPLMLAASNPQQPPPPSPDLSLDDPVKKNNKNINKKVSGPPPAILHIIPLLRLKTTNLDLRDKTGDTALMKAYRIQNWPCAEAIIRAGGSPTMLASSDGYSALIIAAINGYLEGIKLIKHLAPKTVNVTDIYGRSALFHAIANNQVEAVTMLVSEPSPVDIKMIPSRSRCPTPTESTTPNGEKIWFFGMSPMHVAAKQGSLEIASQLLDAGANINQLNDKRETPLMIACMGAYWDLVEFLLANGANVATHDTAGQTVLHRLMYIGDEFEASRGFRLFVKHKGQSILDTVLDSPGQNTALHWAVICDQPEVVNELIILGASANLRNSEGKLAAETVALAPELFDSIGEVISGLWREMARYLKKSNDSGRATPDKPLFTEEELDDIETLFSRDEEGFHEKCAATLVEKFYEKNDENTTLDTDALAFAFRKTTRRPPNADLPPILLNIFERCKGRSLIFRDATIENLTKVRSKSVTDSVH